jgi:O-antigen/teichoic acid export membrane protein
MFRTALLLLSGNAAAALLLLARNLIVARLISVEDYGIAATFAITMAVVEMMSQLGLQQQIVQSKDGDDPQFQAGVQGFQVLRGVIAGILLFFAAGWIANFLKVPDVAWAYQVMALVPIFNALQHFDIHRLNRQMRFWPVVLTGAVPALISLIAIWPLYLWFGDYQVMLWSIILQIGFMMVVSHLVAERPYRAILDRKIMAGSLRFGWPLLVNGMLMFVVFNGDKLIVGRELGMATLAIFAMGFTLTLTPTLVMAKSAQNFFLPQLSAAQSDARFPVLSSVTMQAILVMGLCIVVGVALFAAPLIQILLGDKYAPLVPFMIWLGVMQAVRVAKAGPALVALAAGHTTNAMLANLIRVSVLPICWYVAVNTGDLLVIIWVATLGEIVGYAVSLFLVHIRLNLSLGGLIRPLVGALVLMASCVYFTFQRTAGQGSATLWAVELGVYAILIAALIWSCRDLRLYITKRHINAAETA